MTLVLVLLVLLVPLGIVVYLARTKGRPAGPRAERWIRTQFDPAAFGLVPRDQLDPSRGGPVLDPGARARAQEVADAAWDGDWRVAAAYCEAAGRDWDERWSRIELLIQIAESDDRWLNDWRGAQPDNGDAGTVYAQVLLHRAWEIRGTEYANKVPAERMRQFKELLPAAMAAAQQAADRAPHDPGPWVVMVTAARGMQYSHSRFTELWRNLQLRAPHHGPAHWQALQYWCDKWFGSDTLMFDFAVRAVGTSPAGSTLAGLYLHALDEVEKRGGQRGNRADRHVKARLEDVARRLDTVPETHEDLPRLRHKLAHHLLAARMDREALEQFRRIGPYCGANPWAQDAAGASAAFDHARGRAAYGSRA
ncbi:hypothetical protein ACIBEA_11860 [Streptomyces sp. NPDC051555]|uniref:hypothetical protein n=1 Tax=Streptomyces sp. NPDC051555 TaxID=3365657 RepID=UPI0037A7610F